MERKLAPLFSDFGSLLWSAIQTIFALAQWNELDFFSSLLMLVFKD